MSASSQLTTHSTLHRLPSQSLKQLLGNQHSTAPISTSINNFDESLEGGFQAGHIYEVYGINGSGKPGLAAQLSSNCLQSGGKVLWISTFQSIPLDRLKQVLPDSSLLENLHHIRLNTLGSLFSFLQALPLKKIKYSLIIIDDFANCITRCFDEHAQMVNPKKLKPKQDALESKKHRSIQNILKLLSTYCATNNTSCVLFNSSNILNMSFVEIEKQQPLSASHSSDSFSSQSYRQSQIKPKRFYQQVLVSPMGDHPFWSQYFKARIMLYKDWSSSASSVNRTSTAIYVHLRLNPLLREMNTPKVISFIESSQGIIELSKVDFSSIPAHISHSFTLEEDDFADSDNEETEIRTTVMNEAPIMLTSSPHHRDMNTAKNILPDDLTNGGANITDINEAIEKNDMIEESEVSTKEFEIDETEKVSEVDNVDQNDDELEEEVEGVQEETEVEELQEGTEADELQEETKEQGDIKVVEDMQMGIEKDEVELITNEPSVEDEEEENENLLLHKQQFIETYIQTESNQENQYTDVLEHVVNDQDDEDVSHIIVKDVSVEVEEIEDELEELYPTQPESLNVIQLSQLTQLTSAKRSKSPLNKTIKRLRQPLQDRTNWYYEYHQDYGDSQIPSEEYIPASAPYF